MSPRRNPPPPEWWDISLYDFLENASVNIWAWEFLRRSALLRMGSNPVDAMNPNPNIEDFGAAYNPIFHQHNITINLRNRESTLPLVPTLSPPVRQVNERTQYINLNTLEVNYRTMPPLTIPQGEELFRDNLLISSDGHSDDTQTATFISEGVGIIDQHTREVTLNFDELFEEGTTTVEINLNFRNSIITDELNCLLNGLRQRFPEPGKARSGGDWYGSRVLPVWDLMQFNVSWRWIEENLFEAYQNRNDKVANALKSATKYIDEENWRKLLTSYKEYAG